MTSESAVLHPSLHCDVLTIPGAARCNTTTTVQLIGQSNSPTVSDEHINLARGPCMLPAEILGYIFELVTLGTPYYSNFRFSEFVSRQYLILQSRRKTASPFNLLQVCKYWREVAQSTSSLWSSLTSYQYRQSCPSTSAMKYWLSLSGPAPLHLMLESTRYDFDLDVFHGNKMLQVFATESHRWASLSIRLESTMIQEFTDLVLQSETTTKFPLLEEIGFHFSSRRMPPSLLDAFILAISSINSLRRLYWNDTNGGLSLNGLPWSQIDTVYIDTPLSVQDAALYMTHCSSASSINFADISDKYEGQLPVVSDASTTVLQNVKSLKLRGAPDIFSLLSSFKLPNLTTLDIVAYRPSPGSYHKLGRFLELSKPPLQHLVIFYRCGMPEEDVVAYFQLPTLQSIATVQISYHNVHSAMPHILQAHSGTETSSPQLFGWSIPRCSGFVGWKAFEEGDRVEYLWDCTTLKFAKPILPPEIYSLKSTGLFN